MRKFEEPMDGLKCKTLVLRTLPKKKQYKGVDLKRGVGDIENTGLGERHSKNTGT